MNIFVVTGNTVMIQLNCPFRVAVISPKGQLSIGKIVCVDKVKVTMELKTVFVIEGIAYFYYHFRIMVD